MVNFFLNDTAPTEIYTYLHTYPYTTLFQSPRRRPLPPAAVRLGRAIGRLGPRRGAARGDSDLRRDPRQHQIGRASCRERVCQYVYISVVAVSLNKTSHETSNMSSLSCTYSIS